MKQPPPSRSGVTLVELMVSILLLMIVFLGWMRMNNIQAVRRESLRYAAVEKAAGLLDACDSSAARTIRIGRPYRWKNGSLVPLNSPTELAPMWEEGASSPNSVIGYRILLENLPPTSFSESSVWQNGVWARLELYDDCQAGATRPPFTFLRVFVKGHQ